MTTLNDRAADVAAAVLAERGHRRHRLRPAGSCTRDGVAKRRADPAPGLRAAGARRRARGGAGRCPHRRRSAQPRLRRRACLSDGVPEELLALAYDAQTAGGLLVSLPAEKALSLEAEFERAGVFLARVGSVEDGAGVAARAVAAARAGLHSGRACGVRIAGGSGPAGPDDLSGRLPARRARGRRRAHRHRRVGGHRPAHRIGARLPRVADLHDAARASADVPLVHRVLEPPHLGDHRLHDARARRCGVVHARPRPPRALARDGRLRRDARAGAARRDHRLLRPQPLPRDLAPAALVHARLACGADAARGVETRPRRRHPRCPGSRGSAAPCSSSP